MLQKATGYIVDEKGEEVISERHQKDFHRPAEDEEIGNTAEKSTDSYTDISFEDI